MKLIENNWKAQKWLSGSLTNIYSIKNNVLSTFIGMNGINQTSIRLESYKNKIVPVSRISAAKKIALKAVNNRFSWRRSTRKSPLGGNKPTFCRINKNHNMVKLIKLQHFANVIENIHFFHEMTRTFFPICTADTQTPFRFVQIFRVIINVK